MSPREKFRSELEETLVGLYLRLNGYFCIANYLQHRVDAAGLRSEIDFLALRLPHQSEVLEDGKVQQNDCHLILGDNVIDCVIVEVKKEKVKFNKSVHGNDGESVIKECLRMFGVLPAPEFGEHGAASSLANALYCHVKEAKWAEVPRVKSPEHKLSVRMIVFASNVESNRKHFELQHVLNQVRKRTAPGYMCRQYSRLAWRGIDRLILETLDSCNGAELILQDFVERCDSARRTPDELA